MTPGERIKKIRESLGLNQEQFAQQVGAESKGTVSNWEKDRRLPNLEQLIKISKVANVTLDYIVLGKEDERGFKSRDYILVKRLREWGIETVETLDLFLNKADIYDTVENLIRQRLKEMKRKRSNILSKWKLPNEYDDLQSTADKLSKVADKMEKYPTKKK